MKSRADTLKKPKPGPMKDEAESSPTVLNIIMLGTDEHNTQVKSVLTELETSIKTTKNQFVHLINGPGAIPTDAAVTDNDLMLGNYDFSSSFDEVSGTLVTERKKREISSPKLKRVKGLAMGEGCEDGVAETSNIVATLLKAGKEPLIINFYGFSRGADNVLRACNELHKSYPDKDIRCNVLAIDPVAGPTRKGEKEGRLIPPNVKRYESILMEHERRKEFTPQDKTRLQVANVNETKVIQHFLPGIHTHGTYFYDDMKDTHETPRVLWDIVEKFAKRVGTNLHGLIPFATLKVEENQYQYTKAPARPLTDDERLIAYSKMSSAETQAKYTAVAAKLPLITGTRKFVSQKRFYFLHGHDVFQDEQHLQLFKQYYPHFFDFFFQMNCGGSTLQDVKNDINKIKSPISPAPEVFKFLIKHESFKFLAVKGFNLDSIVKQGIPLVYDEFNNEENKKLKQLWEGIQYAVFPILSGNDNSLPKNVAKKLLNDVYEEIIKGVTVDEKVKFIEKRLRSLFIEHAETSVLFETKLMSLVSAESVDPLRQAINFLDDVDKNESKLSDLMKNALHLILSKVADSVTKNPSLDQLERHATKTKVERQLRAFKINTVRELISKMSKEEHDYAKPIVNYLKKRLHYNYGASIADRVIGLLVIHDRQPCTYQVKLIAKHAISIFQHLNYRNLGNDPELIRIAIKKVQDALRLANAYDSAFNKALIDFSFHHLALTSHVEVTAARHDDLAEALALFSSKTDQINLTASIAAYLKKREKLPENLTENFTTEKAEQILKTTELYLSSANDEEFKDNYHLNRAHKLANLAKEKLPDDSELKKSAQNILQKISSKIDSSRTNNIYYGSKRFFNFFKRNTDKKSSITRVDVSNESCLKFNYKFDPLEHDGWTRLSSSSYAMWAQKEIEALRGEFIEQNGNDNDFAIVISGNFTHHMSKALATYCASESIDYTDSITNYKPSQEEIDSFVKELDTATSNKPNSP